MSDLIFTGLIFFGTKLCFNKTLFFYVLGLCQNFSPKVEQKFFRPTNSPYN